MSRGDGSVTTLGQEAPAAASEDDELFVTPERLPSRRARRRLYRVEQRGVEIAVRETHHACRTRRTRQRGQRERREEDDEAACHGSTR